jgi:hypothetical protein
MSQIITVRIDNFPFEFVVKFLLEYSYDMGAFFFGDNPRVVNKLHRPIGYLNERFIRRVISRR